MKKYFYLPLLCIVLTCLLILSCSQKSDEPKEKILVKIGDSVTISENEFMRRVEYMPRPGYCKQNTYLSKKIMLNSLIAEKLFALQEGQDSPMRQDSSFQSYLKGRKEQAMRLWMYHEEAADQVELPQQEIDRHFKNAGRTFDLEYFSLSKPEEIKAYVKNPATDSTSFKAFYENLTDDIKIPTKQVTYNAMEHREVHRALYDQEVKVGEILQPIKIAEGDYLVIRVKGWSSEMAVTEPQQQQRINEVVEKLTEYHAAKIWDQRILDVMRGKRLDFDEKTFHILAEQFQQYYFRSAKEQRNDLIASVWGKENADLQLAVQSINDDLLLQQPFMVIDGNTWTVAELRQRLIEHPLVFRKMNMRPEEFAEQFKLAVVDLVRDYYLTQEAYKKGYDQVNIVQRNVNMYRDAMLATYHLHNYLLENNKVGAYSEDYLRVVEEFLNPYVDSLQAQVYKDVQLDFDAFESIALSSVDMFVQQPGLPFKDVVPIFPVITTDHLIQYIAKMEEE